MENFDLFNAQLLEESKRFLEKAHESTENVAKQAFLHASLLLSMSALEASINSISEGLFCEPYEKEYSIIERALLLEKEIKFDKGEFTLGTNLKMTKIIERVEYLYFKFSKKKLDASEAWYPILIQSIRLRNELVHPKANVKLTEKQVGNCITCVIGAINTLFILVYRRGLPAYNLGLNSLLDF